MSAERVALIRRTPETAISPRRRISPASRKYANCGKSPASGRIAAVAVWMYQGRALWVGVWRPRATSEPFSSGTCAQPGTRSAGNERSTPGERRSAGLPRRNYLAEALEALLGQSYEDFEMIISDNASTDGTPESAVATKSRTHGSVMSASRATSAWPRITTSSSGRRGATCCSQPRVIERD